MERCASMEKTCINNLSHKKRLKLVQIINVNFTYSIGRYKLKTRNQNYLDLWIE